MRSARSEGVQGVRGLQDCIMVGLLMKDIQLRGHHVGNLGTFYFRLYREPVPDYAREFVGRSPELFSYIIENPQLSIEIVSSLDTICLGNADWPKCLRRKEECNTQVEPDVHSLAEYGLSLGKLTSGELIQKIMEYKGRTGFDSPRMKRFLENIEMRA